MYDIDVCTANKARYRNGNRTKEARAYSESVHREMYKVKEQVTKFSKYFNDLPENLKDLELIINILVPQGKMYTKQGYISKASIDIDNYLKLLIDAVMDARFNGREFRHGDYDIVNLDMDDKFITKLVVDKSENPNPESKKWDIQFILRLRCPDQDQSLDQQ